VPTLISIAFEVTSKNGDAMSGKTPSVHWEGRGKQGAGKISTQTDALKSYLYGYGSRFEDDRRPRSFKRHCMRPLRRPVPGAAPHEA
jgi:hypothetical protein